MFKEKVVKKFAILITSLLISSIAAEIMIRIIGSYDIEGTFILKDRRLLPLHLPINQTKTLIDKYNSSIGETMYIYDPLIGWNYRENHISTYYGDMYQHSTYGIRTASKDTPIATSSDKIRIAIFGDSFTHSDDVKFEESWGYYLEENLKNKGFDVEVLNFGLGGGAMDQAYLRWKHYGSKLSPDIVIFGFQEENRERNVSLIRTIHHINNGLPFSKPSFIIENEQLKLINSPTLSPEQSLAAMKDINNWNLVKYENYYQPAYYEDHFWLKSKLIALIYTYFKWGTIEHDVDVSNISKAQEQNELAYKIIDQFKMDVETKGSKFFVVNLPTSGSIGYFINGNAKFIDLLNNIKQRSKLIECNQFYNEYKKGTLLYIPHYNSLGNKIIADDIANFLELELTSAN